MNQRTKIAIIVVIAVATLIALAFYITKSKTASLETQTPTTVQNNVAPTTPKPAQTTPATEQIPPLPSDNKQAIESELKGIDEALQSAETSISSEVDGELGL